MALKARTTKPTRSGMPARYKSWQGTAHGVTALTERVCGWPAGACFAQEELERLGKRFDVLAEERKRALLKSQEDMRAWQRHWEQQQELAAASVATTPRTGSPTLGPAPVDSAEDARGSHGSGESAVPVGAFEGA